MIERINRLVIDTNVFVSATLGRRSTSALVVSEAFSRHIVLTSSEVFQELSQVMLRQKFLRFRSLPEREAALKAYSLALYRVEVERTPRVTDCRDPDDNVFLQLALAGNANFIITGDSDLLALHPWRGIGILSPADYLALSE